MTLKSAGFWLFVAMLLAPLSRARAQGCVATGQSGMMNEACHLTAGSDASSPYLEKGRRQLNVGYRWFRSHRHFVGAEEQEHRADEGSEVINRTNLIDLSLTWGLTSRAQVAIGLPYVINSRSGPIRSAGAVVDRSLTQSQGIGDARIVFSRWMREPSPHAKGNWSLGLGAKFPTGRYNAKDDHKTLTGFVNREVDQSIQPGDGGTGAILQLQAFRQTGEHTSLFAAGSYLFNPRGNNGVSTNRTRASESIMSVADQYLVTAGVARSVWPRRGVSVSLAARLEGLPPRDVFGPDADFRRPGYTLSVEPGVSFRLGGATVGVNVPWSVLRERQKSVPDLTENRHGDAAFADYAFLVSVSQRF